MGVNAGKRGVNTDGHPLPRQAGDRFLRAAGTHVGWLCWSTCSLTYMPVGTPVPGGGQPHPVYYAYAVPDATSLGTVPVRVGVRDAKVPFPEVLARFGAPGRFPGPKGGLVFFLCFFLWGGAGGGGVG